ncbi:MAG: TetR family transcriptional regulator [Polaromonas sp.]
MARRTKEEAQETRSKLLDAAECLFQAQGVSGTSLQDIATRAGTTRGAVYWHFKDKADLFNAMMERVTLPLEAYFHPEDVHPEGSIDSNANALQRTRSAILNALRQIVTDAQTRRVLEVATQKVEYVEEHKTIRLRHIAARNGFYSRTEENMAAASRQTNIKFPMPVSMAARGLHALIDGLIQNWLLEPEAFDLVDTGRNAMDAYLRGLGLPHTQDAA